MASQTFTHVYAGLIAIINTKFPANGELVLKRLVQQFRRSFRRNDKATTLGTVKFIAHLSNQQVAHELLCLEILTLLLDQPTDDSVEVAIAFLKESGQFLTEVSPRGIHAIFERMRAVLNDGDLETRTQYMIEVMYAVRKDGFKDHLRVQPELDLVEDDDQITHLLSLDEDMDAEKLLDVFKFDPRYEENEDKYKEIREEILGDGSDDSDNSDDDSDDEDDEDEGGAHAGTVGTGAGEPMKIVDMTEENMRRLRRTIYLTIRSSISAEECAHKLLKMTLKPGYEQELANMVIECCTQERTYMEFYGKLAGRFAELQQEYTDAFCTAFMTEYQTVHRLETNKLRQMAKLFSFMFVSDALPWNIFEVIQLNEVDTTSSSRIFIKELFLQMSEVLGVPAMVKRFTDPTMQVCFNGLFPRDPPKNTRFAINFFTSIGLGGLTDDLRDHLKVAVQRIQAQRHMEVESDAESDSDSSSSSSSSDSSSSSSDSDSSGSSSSSSGSGSGSGSSSSSSSGSNSDAGAKKKKMRKSRSSPLVSRPKEDAPKEDVPKELQMTGEDAFAARARLSNPGGDDRGRSGPDDRGRGRDDRGRNEQGRDDRGRGGRDDRDRGGSRRSRSPPRRRRERSDSPDDRERRRPRRN